MVVLSEFVKKLEEMLNSSTASGVPTFTINGIPVRFAVRSPSLPFVDSIDDKENKSFALPVMVQSLGAGSYEAYPDMGFFDISYTITFRFPMVVFNEIIAYFNYLASQVVGKIVDIGPLSGSAVCGLGAPSLGQMAYMEVAQIAQVSAETSKIFGKSVNISDEWADMNFEFYMAGANKLNESGGFIYGNQIETSLSVKFSQLGGVALTESLLIVSPSQAQSSLTYEQQALSGNYQKSLVTNTGSAVTLTVFVRANDFWSNFINDFTAGVLQKTTSVILSSIIKIGSSITCSLNGTLGQNCIIKDVSFSYGYGMPLTCTFTVSPKATPGEL